jgi:hypothetical protein
MWVSARWSRRRTRLTHVLPPKTFHFAVKYKTNRANPSGSTRPITRAARLAWARRSITNIRRSNPSATLLPNPLVPSQLPSPPPFHHPLNFAPFSLIFPRFFISTTFVKVLQVNSEISATSSFDDGSCTRPCCPARHGSSRKLPCCWRAFWRRTSLQDANLGHYPSREHLHLLHLDVGHGKLAQPRGH